MTKIEKTSAFSRRSLLKGAGALVVSVGSADRLSTPCSASTQRWHKAPPSRR